MRRLAVGLVGGAVLTAGCAVGIDRAFPPDLSRLTPSRVVLARDGTLLRAFLTTDGKWRLAPRMEDLSPNYVAALVATEDRRFRSHPGVDPLAVVRAAWQMATRGRVVSGASTVAMQVARMLEPRPRTFASKVVEAFRALQVEERLGRDGVLRAYATLAPMGGNLEGVRAGSLAWFGREPTGLSDAEAATLVALPRSPERLRPDLHPGRVAAVRDAVLARLLPPDLGGPKAAASVPVSATRHPMPSLAFKEAGRLVRSRGGAEVGTTLDAALQGRLEGFLRAATAALPSPVTVAAMIADWRTGEVLARADGSSPFDEARAGMVDLTRAVRSPGSTLKPFVYGMAFDRLLAHPDSVVADEPTRYDGYAPRDFDGGFAGDVTVRRALQASLNLPAVLVLNRVGPVAFAERLRDAGLSLTLPRGDLPPGLPIVLGGVGSTLETLTNAYAALAAGGEVRPLSEDPRAAGGVATVVLMRAPAAAAVVDILAGTAPPPGAPPATGRVAYKTGTSYGFRDGWAVGFDGARVVGVWVGRPDGGSCDGCVGARAAALLFRALDLLPSAPLRLPTLSPVFAGPPPMALARLGTKGRVEAVGGPKVTYPLPDARVLVDERDPRVGVAATGGTMPYVWLADGVRVAPPGRSRGETWRPKEDGFATLTVVDAEGRSDSLKVRVERLP